MASGIPHSLLNMSYLQVLSMESNMVGGTLPPSIGDALPDLQMLVLGRNLLRGYIPASLGNASNLMLVDLSSNNFAGTVGEWIRKLMNLTYLHLNDNNLM